MANDEHVALLKQGVDVWNAWRERNPTTRPDLANADLNEVNLEPDQKMADGVNLNEADLQEVNFSKANLYKASFYGADLRKANLSAAWLGNAVLIRANLSDANLRSTYLGGADSASADLRRANLGKADLEDANLIYAKLDGANLNEANLSRANLYGAKLRGAKLDGAMLYHADLAHADLTRSDLTCCRVFGVSAWSLKLDGANQQNLIITDVDEPEITVDNIEVAQFIHLLLHNEKIRDVIDTITSKAVLILGRFTDERKAVLDALREELRKRDYLPILFDFEKPRSRDTDETITLLARMSRFIIADVSDAKAVLQELRGIVPDLPSVPVQPIILATREEPGMFDFYRNRPSFLSVHRYVDQNQLLADLGDKVIRPAELKVQELRG
jgi:uncharacterized protein YjbI with pentapeptide repeats